MLRYTEEVFCGSKEVYEAHVRSVIFALVACLLLRKRLLHQDTTRGCPSPSSKGPVLRRESVRSRLSKAFL